LGSREKYRGSAKNGTGMCVKPGKRTVLYRRVGKPSKKTVQGGKLGQKHYRGRERMGKRTVWGR